MHDVDDLKHSSTHAHTHAHKGWRNCTLPARMCERLHAQRVYMATYAHHAVGHQHACVHKFNDVITHDVVGGAAH